jgi:hypothetical protein
MVRLRLLSMAYGLLRRDVFRGRQVEAKSALPGLSPWRQSTASIESFPFGKYPKLSIGHSGEHFRVHDCGGSRGSNSAPARNRLSVSPSTHGTIGIWIEAVELDRPNQLGCHRVQTVTPTEK